MADLESSFSGECQEKGDQRDGDDQLLELPPPVPLTGDAVFDEDKFAGEPSDLGDNSGGDELVEDAMNCPGQDAGNAKKTSTEQDRVEEEDVAEDEIEMVQEIPMIRLRSRSSSSSSSGSSSDSRSRSRSRRRSYSTDEDIEIIEDSTSTTEQTARKDSEKDSNSIQKSSEAQNREEADDEDILEVVVVKSNPADVTVQRRSSSQDRQKRPNRRRSRDQRSRSREEDDSRNTNSRSSRDRDGHNNYRREVSSASSAHGAYNRDMSNRGSQPSRNYREWKRERQHSGKDEAWNRGTQGSWNDPARSREPDVYQYRNTAMSNPFSVPPPNYRYPHVENNSISHGGDAGSHSQQQHSYTEPPPGYPKQEEEDSGVRCESLTFSDGFDCHSFSSSSASQSVSPNVDVRNLSPVVSEGGLETLRPGNYLLLTWDTETLAGSNYQLGCQSFHGDQVLLCLLPDTEVGLNLAKHHPHCPLVIMSGRPYVRHTNTAQFQQCLEPAEALGRLLDFLERSKNRTRPSYDGLVLLSHNLDHLTDIIKVFRKHNLYQRFSGLVSAVGSLTNLLLHKNVRGVTDSSSLETCYYSVFQRKMYPIHPMSDDRARICFDIVGKVLESPPSFRNLFSLCCQPLSSSEIQRKVNFRTREERLEMFEMLEEDIQAQLESQRRESQARETFYPGQTDSEDKPVVTARQIVQQLVEVGFQFDQLLEIAKLRGIGNLELQVRTAFLGQMAGRIVFNLVRILSNSLSVVRSDQEGGGSVHPGHTTRGPILQRTLSQTSGEDHQSKAAASTAARAENPSGARREK